MIRKTLGVLTALAAIVGFSVLGTASPARADGWQIVSGNVVTYVVQGENARVEAIRQLWRYVQGPAGCNPDASPSDSCFTTTYGWKFVTDRKWNPSGGASTVAFQSITGGGVKLGWATMGDGATHCWFPNPAISPWTPSTCSPNTSQTSQFNGGPYTTTYKVTVKNVANGSAACYVLNLAQVTPGGAGTIVNGSCP